MKECSATFSAEHSFFTFSPFHLFPLGTKKRSGPHGLLLQKLKLTTIINLQTNLLPCVITNFCLAMKLYLFSFCTAKVRRNIHSASIMGKKYSKMPTFVDLYQGCNTIIALLDIIFAKNRLNLLFPLRCRNQHILLRRNCPRLRQ